MRDNWCLESPTLVRACLILGVTPAPGIVRVFRDLDEQGYFDHCKVVGDFLRVFLTYSLEYSLKHRINV